MARPTHLLGILRPLIFATALLTMLTEAGTTQGNPVLVDPGRELPSGTGVDRAREVFGSEERVTLNDVLIVVPERLRLRLEHGKSAQDVGLTASTRGLALPIVSVDAPPRGQGTWTQVIYLDAPLSAEGTIPWAVQLLAASLDDLLLL